MTNQRPGAAADAMLHEVEEELGTHSHPIAGAKSRNHLVVATLTAIGWALLDVATAIREQTAAEYERQAVVPTEPASLYSPDITLTALRADGTEVAVTPSVASDGRWAYTVPAGITVVAGRLVTEGDTVSGRWTLN